VARQKPSAHQRAVDLARLVRKAMKGKTADQFKSYARGYFTAALTNDPDLVDFRDVYFNELEG
jgi:hypothetical protein